MKRDMDLIRRILLRVEEEGNNRGRVVIESIEGYDEDLVLYNVKLLVGAGYLNAAGTSAGVYLIRDITWEGHDFLDSVRNRAVWRKVHEKLGPSFNQVSVSVIKALADKMALIE